MCDDPLIHQGSAVRKGKAHPKVYLPKNTPAAKYNLDQKEYFLIRDLWQRGTDSIHNMHFVKNGDLFYWNKSWEKCTQTAKNKKKKNCM